MEDNQRVWIEKIISSIIISGLLTEIQMLQPAGYITIKIELATLAITSMNVLM